MVAPGSPAAEQPRLTRNTKAQGMVGSGRASGHPSFPRKVLAVRRTGWPWWVVAGGGPPPAMDPCESPDAGDKPKGWPTWADTRSEPGKGSSQGSLRKGRPLARPAVGSRACRRRAPDALALCVYDVFLQLSFGLYVPAPNPLAPFGGLRAENS